MATEQIPIAASEPPARAPQPVLPPRARRADAALTVLAIAALFAVCYVAKLVIVTLLVAILLAFMLEPIVSFFQRFRVPRPIGAFLALLAVAGLLYGATYFFYNRAVEFVHELPKYSEKIRHEAERYKQKFERVQQTTEKILPGGEQNKNAVTVTQATNWSDWVSKGLGGGLEFLLTVSFLPFLVYFMLTWQEHTRAATVMLFRMENRNTAYVTLGRISAMLKSFIIGNLLIGLFLSGVSTIVFAAIGVPYFYFIGPISGFLSLVPYLGVLFAMGPPLLAGLGQLGGTEMLIVVLTVLALHLFAFNVLYPKTLGRRLQLNPLAVTISLMLWGWLWGAMGLILAVPITAAIKIIFDHIEALSPYGKWLGE